jgi:hypothetical protein
MNRSKLSQLVVLVVVVAACGEGPMGSGPQASVAVQSGDEQFGSPSTELVDPLQVVVVDPVDELPLEEITVTWTVASGNGAVVTPTSQTDENGVATATLRLGSGIGEYVVEARVQNIVGQPARFRSRAVNTPVISTDGTPPFANVGDTITITGQNFSPQADDNFVMFGGFRGKVVSSTTTQLRAVIPACVPARVVPVTASLGAVTSTPVNMELRGGGTITSLQLARGEVRTISDPAELGCIRLPGGITGYKVLLIPQNHSEVAGSEAALRLAGLSATSSGTVIRPEVAPRMTNDVATSFENMLRARESKFLERSGGGVNLRPQTSAAACPSLQQVGDTCQFQVINNDDKFQNVNASLRAISTRALIYQDLNAPANGLAAADFQTLASSFDDPIYGAITSAFGNVSDIDSNQRVVILLTPLVNALTPRGSSGFIAGFFFGCDLVTRSVCGGSNGAEIFYTMVADPTGIHSDVRTVNQILAALPPVLSHEFQHMIHFGVREATDALWLSEGLAHHAEDIIADHYAARGDATRAQQYRIQNYTRSTRYLREPGSTSLVAENGSGTLEMRGAAWLFIKYLVGQYGAGVLRTLVEGDESSVTNVTAATDASWSSLVANWSVALYADDAPELLGVSVAPQYTFPNINLRTALGSGLDYPLRPSTESFEDFVRTFTLPASSQEYVTVQAGANAQPFSLNLAGALGGAFSANAEPQLSILRLQ